MIFLRYLSISCLVFVLGACGGMVQDARLDTYTIEEDLWAELQIDVETRGVRLPSLSFPIQNEIESLGRISISSGLDENSLSTLGLAGNISALLNQDFQRGAYLPNGLHLPIAGVNSMDAVALPLPSGILVYLVLSDSSAAFGAAIPIAELDRLGDEVGGLNLFPQFEMGDVRGTLGFYSGRDAGESGLAFFVDVSDVVLREEARGDNSIVLAEKRVNRAKPINFFSPSSRKEKKAQRVLSKIMRKSPRWHLVH